MHVGVYYLSVHIHLAIIGPGYAQDAHTKDIYNFTDNRFD